MKPRNLVVLLIDDQFVDSRAGLNNIRTVADVIPVNGIEGAITLLRKLSPGRDVIDIILCDISMEKDQHDEFHFVEKTQNEGNEATADDKKPLEYDVRPLYEIDGLPNQSMFKPYGPMLALPFTKFFVNGGIIAPISTYWKNPKLINRPTNENGSINGYVYTALALIWGQAHETTFSMSAYGEKFSQMYAKARDEPMADIIVNQFYDSVLERRSQLYQNAAFLPDLSRLTVEMVTGDPDAGFRIWDNGGREDVIAVKSLYADVFKNIRYAQRSGNHKFIEGMQEQLELEKKEYSDRHFDDERVYKFCEQFILLHTDMMIDHTFIERYQAAFEECDLSARPCREIPAIQNPVDTPPHIRRFLLLFAQIYTVTCKLDIDTDEKTLPTNKRIASVLGFHRGRLADNSENINDTPADAGKDDIKKKKPSEPDTFSRPLIDFVVGGRLDRKNKIDRAAISRKQSGKFGVSWNFWMGRPFNQIATTDSVEGWSDFNLIGPPPNCQKWVFMEMDRTLAKRFGRSLVKHEKAEPGLPFGLDT